MQITFIACLPDIQSAILISGEGATRVKLDIPESEIANAIKLVLMKGQAFRVTIENEIKCKAEDKQADAPQFLSESKQKASVSKRAKWKPKRQTH